MAFFITVHTSIVLFQCRVAQCLASWGGHGPWFLLSELNLQARLPPITGFTLQVISGFGGGFRSSSAYILVLR